MSSQFHPPHALHGKPEFKFATVFATFSGQIATKDLANNLQSVYEDLDAAGAQGAAERLAQLDMYADPARKSYDPAALLLRVNLDETRTELDDVMGAKARNWSAWRNGCALAPLLLTWVTLGIATAYYYFYYTAHDHAGKNDVVVQPFIVAWESGFDHHLFFTFAQVALLDFAMLAVVLFLTIGLHREEGKALGAASDLFQRVSRVVSEYVDSLYEQKIQSDLRASPEQWAQRAEEVITRAMTGVEKTINTAQKSIQDAATVLGGFEIRTNTFFTRIDTRIVDLVQKTSDTLTSTVQDLRRELGTYTDQTTKLLESVDKVKQAADTLRTNVEEYTRLARSIDGHVASLEVSQSALVGRMTAAADSIGDVAQTFSSETLGKLADEVSEAVTALRSAIMNQTMIPDEYLAAAQTLHQVADNLADKVAQQPVHYGTGGGAHYGTAAPVGAYGSSSYGPAAYTTAGYPPPPPGSSWWNRARSTVRSWFN